ncbi:MAG: hypothetical protein ABSH44_02655 [Bryobacteraceae bacterium]|jgi:hypothetical protein
MKPLQIVLLLAAGAISGALVMKVAQRPSRPPVPAPAPVVAQAPAPAPVPEPAFVTPPLVAGPVVPPSPARPSPFVEKNPQPVPQPQLKGDPEPISREQDEPVPAAAAPVAAPAPEHAPPPVPAEPENVTPPPPPPPEPHKVTLNAGMLIPVRLVDGLSSERNAPGDAFIATLDRELVVDGFVIAERGARVEGRVVASDPGGKLKGVAAIAVKLTRLHTSDGQNVAIQTDSFERHAEPASGDDAQKVVAGAAIGAVIGAVAGGGKGAAIGAGVGAGAGAGDVMLTRGKPAALPSETRISFRLRAPITLTERR